MLAKVFRIIINAKLKLKGTKCVFGTHSVTFLGHFVTGLDIVADRLAGTGSGPRSGADGRSNGRSIPTVNRT